MEVYRYMASWISVLETSRAEFRVSTVSLSARKTDTDKKTHPAMVKLWDTWTSQEGCVGGVAIRDLVTPERSSTRRVGELGDSRMPQKTK